MYHGFTYSENVVADPAAVTGSEITALNKITNANAYNEVKPTSAIASKAWRQYFVAIPSSYGTSIPKIKDGNGIDCTVKEAGSITCQYGEGSNGVTTQYKVYYVNNAADYDTLSLQITW